MAAKNHLGLEINDRFIRYAKLSKEKDGFNLAQYGEVKLPAGVIEGGSIRRGPLLLQFLIDIRKRSKGRGATVSHSPDQVYLADLLSEAGFKNLYFESAGEAVARAAMPAESAETDMIIYFTGDKMDIYAGLQRTMNLLVTFNFSSVLLGKMRDQEIIYSFIAEKIDEQYISWHTHQAEDKKRSKIKKIIISGEVPNPESLADYLQASLRIKIELPNVWQNIFSLERRIPEINFHDSLRYSAALGLALRGLSA